MGEVLFICEGNTEVFLLFKILEKEFNIEIPKELKDNGNLKTSCYNLSFAIDPI